ncbi:hypothetical protein Tco_0654401 [Tanacetum coccineum]|uniref:Uncharacterized protein n=1 Tax=Tanacetum coccineum TaxID=301880 RepID=A0ABQ4X3D2_9ASTR
MSRSHSAELQLSLMADDCTSLMNQNATTAGGGRKLWWKLYSLRHSILGDGTMMEEGVDVDRCGIVSCATVQLVGMQRSSTVGMGIVMVSVTIVVGCIYVLKATHEIGWEHEQCRRESRSLDLQIVTATHLQFCLDVCTE